MCGSRHHTCCTMGMAFRLPRSHRPWDLPRACQDGPRRPARMSWREACVGDATVSAPAWVNFLTSSCRVGRSVGVAADYFHQPDRCGSAVALRDNSEAVGRTPLRPGTRPTPYG